MIDPRLRLLQLVAHHGTVTAAAGALHYTPSAASYQLRMLARELDVQLLADHGRGIQLTAAAHTLLTHTEALQAQVERARADLTASTDEPGGLFTLCGFSTAATHLLPPAAAAMRDRYQRLSARVIEADPSRCFDLLLSGEADLGLVVATGTTPSQADARFDQRRLFDDPLDLVVPTDHPFTRRTRVTLFDAAEEAWIVGSPETTYHQLVLTACAAAGFTPQIAHYADEWDTGTALVAHHFGIILVPRLARIRTDWPVARIRLHGDPTPARRILTVVRAGSREKATITDALDDITAAAADVLPAAALDR